MGHPLQEVLQRRSQEAGSLNPGLTADTHRSLNLEIKQLIHSAAREAGFEMSGIAPVDLPGEAGHYADWIAAGHAGEMKYLEARNSAGELKRASLRSAVPWARSVVVCAINYNTSAPYSTDVRSPERGWISRYAWGREDYHHSVMRRLQRVEEKLRAACESQPLQTRCYVDTGPVSERMYAKYAAVGWVGKNTCIINQKIGSWLFLGVILTSLELQPDLPAPDRCGTCMRCIEACPTDAFVGPYQLDANRCISYLTIEKRGDIPLDLRDGLGHHVFGCDICQDVCPWNRKAPITAAEEFQPRPQLLNPNLDWLARLEESSFQEVFRKSPVRRARFSGLRRNAAIAMGNSGLNMFIPVLRKLAADEQQSVAEAAAWALQKLSAIGNHSLPGPVLTE